MDSLLQDDIVMNSYVYKNTSLLLPPLLLVTAARPPRPDAAIRRGNAMGKMTLRRRQIDTIRLTLASIPSGDVR